MRQTQILRARKRSRPADAELPETPTQPAADTAAAAAVIERIDAALAASTG